MKVQKKEHAWAALLLVFSAFLIAWASGPRVAAGNDVPASRAPGTLEPVSAPSTYRLIGTVEGGAFVGAVLDDAAAGTQTFYRLRDKLPDGSQIVKVRSDSISVKRSDGSIYDLYTIHDMKPAAPSPAGRPPVAEVPAAPRFPDNQRTADTQTRAARPVRPDTGANQGTYTGGSNTAVPGDGRAKRLQRQKGRGPQPPG